MKDSVFVKIDGKIHSFWTEVTVSRSIEHGAHGFDLTLTDSFDKNSDTSPRVIKRGQAVEIFIGNQELVLSGYIDVVNPSYNATTHTLNIKGRSKIGDLIDCSTTGRQFIEGVTFKYIAEEVCAEFGIKVLVDPSAQAVAEEKLTQNYMLDIGETIWCFLEQIAREKAILLISDANGNLRMTRAGSQQAEVALALGRNIKSSRGAFSHRNVFSDYIITAQQPNILGQERNVADRVFSMGKKSIEGRRYRPMVVCSDSPADNYGCARKAAWYHNVQESRAESIVYTVQGWRQKAGGPLWQPNMLVFVDDSLIGWKCEGLISGVHFRLNENGTTTELKIVPKGAFELEPDAIDTDQPESISDARKRAAVKESFDREMETKWLAVEQGALTFGVEGNDIKGNIFFSRVPHIPHKDGKAIGNSGITIGRGLDLGGRSQAEVESIFSSAALKVKPISSALLNWLKGATGKTGQTAYNYWLTIDDHVPKGEQEITRQMQYELFAIIYPHYVAETKRLTTKKDVSDAYINGKTIDWDALSQKVKDVLTDLTYRGDYTGEDDPENPNPNYRGNSRKEIIPAIYNDQVGGLTGKQSKFYEVMDDDDFWIGKFGVDENRAGKRVEALL